MFTVRVLIASVVLLAGSLLPARADAGDPVRDAVIRALPLIQRSAATFVDKRACFSCHHNGLSIMTLRLAERHRFVVDAKALDAVETKTFGVLRSPTAVDVAIQSTTLSDPTPNDSLLLMAADASGLPPDVATAVLARRLSRWQRPDGRWMTSDFRPPHSSSEFSATATAIAAVRAYLPDELAAERDSTLRRAVTWLTTSWPHSTEDAAFRVLGLVWADASRDTIDAASRVLLSMQLPTGGWPQLESYAADAYSTGEAFYALTASGMPASAPQWQRGARFLLSSQAPDGSWHVRSRLVSPADVSPPYFHTGFPYGDKDEFLSYAGSCWAVMALVSSLPETPATSASTRGPDKARATSVSPRGLDKAGATSVSPRGSDNVLGTPVSTRGRDNPATSASPRGLDNARASEDGTPGWLRIALFGTVRDLTAALDAGLDPNSKTPGGTTVLMAAALDADKTRLLLSRGADPTTRSQSRVDALTIALLHPGTADVVTMLLDAGAAVEPPEDMRVRRTPLAAAALAGDLPNVQLLLHRGAKPSLDAVSDALTFGHTDVVRTLVEAGADVTGVDSTGINLLHWAAITNRASMIPILAKAGVPINAIDDFGYTPLMYAATVDEGDTDTLRALIAAGANPTLKNDDGRTPMQQAKKLGHIEIVRALGESGDHGVTGITRRNGGTGTNGASK